MKLMKILLLVVITSMLMVSVPLWFALHSLNQTVLKPYSWDEYTKENENELNHMVITKMEEQFNQIQHPLRDQYEADFQSALQLVITEQATPEWIRLKFNELQEHIWDYLLGKTALIEPIDIHELREALTEGIRQRLAEEGIPDQLSHRIVSEMEQQVPVSINLHELFSMDEEQASQLKQVYNQTQDGYKNILILVVTLFACGLMITFFPVFALRWSGYVFVLTSIVALICVLLFNGIDLAHFTRVNMVTYMLTDAVQKVNQMVAITVIIGILLILLSHFTYISDSMEK